MSFTNTLPPGTELTPDQNGAQSTGHAVFVTVVSISVLKGGHEYVDDSLPHLEKAPMNNRNDTVGVRLFSLPMELCSKLPTPYIYTSYTLYPDATRLVL